MNAAELDRRSRTYDGWIPPWVVSLLVEHGHLEEVRVRAGRGDWFCALRVAELLIEEGRRPWCARPRRPGSGSWFTGWRGCWPGRGGSTT